MAEATKIESVIEASYSEPDSLDQFTARILAMFGDTEVTAENKPLMDLLLDMGKRITDLETALMPFTTQAMLMQNARMNLAADGRPDEPGGGTWVSGLKNISMTKNEGLFLKACDVIGRGRAEVHMLKVFAAVQAQKVAQLERDAHVENPTLQGPTGGPISGRTQ